MARGAPWLWRFGETFRRPRLPTKEQLCDNHGLCSHSILLTRENLSSHRRHLKASLAKKACVWGWDRRQPCTWPIGWWAVLSGSVNPAPCGVQKRRASLTPFGAGIQSTPIGNRKEQNCRPATFQLLIENGSRNIMQFFGRSRYIRNSSIPHGHVSLWSAIRKLASTVRWQSQPTAANSVCDSVPNFVSIYVTHWRQTETSRIESRVRWPNATGLFKGGLWRGPKRAGKRDDFVFEQNMSFLFYCPKMVKNAVKVAAITLFVSDSTEICACPRRADCIYGQEFRQPTRNPRGSVNADSSQKCRKSRRWTRPDHKVVDQAGNWKISHEK